MATLTHPAAYLEHLEHLLVVARANEKQAMQDAQAILMVREKRNSNASGPDELPPHERAQFNRSQQKLEERALGLRRIGAHFARIVAVIETEIRYERSRQSSDSGTNRVPAVHATPSVVDSIAGQ